MDRPLKHAQSLPAYLIDRYNNWKQTNSDENKQLLRHLADEGQSPAAMVISCCDSRVHTTAIFGAEQGDFFMHRNIASLVPPFDPDSCYHGTPAAIEYGVTALKVSHLLVVGHSACGGVKGCHDMCSGNAPALEDKNSFVGRWIEILRPGFDRLAAGGKEVSVDDLEKEAVLVSLENLMSYPFVKAAVEAGELTLHGLWNDIGDGVVEVYNSETQAFAAI